MQALPEQLVARGLPGPNALPVSEFSFVAFSASAARERPDPSAPEERLRAALQRRDNWPLFALGLGDQASVGAAQARRAWGAKLTFFVMSQQRDGAPLDAPPAQAIASWLRARESKMPRLCVLLAPRPLSVHDFPVARRFRRDGAEAQAILDVMLAHFKHSEDRLLILSAGDDFSEVRELSTASGKVIGHEVICGGAAQSRIAGVRRLVDAQMERWGEERSDKLLTRSIGRHVGAGFAELHLRLLPREENPPELRVLFHLADSRRDEELHELLCNPADHAQKHLPPDPQLDLDPRRNGVLLEAIRRPLRSEDLVRRCLHLSGSDRIQALIEAERPLVEGRRNRRHGLRPGARPDLLDDSGPRPAQSRFTGLALSGGGIRSATVSLGFMRELQSNEQLDVYDYISSVSGGSYANGYLQVMTSPELLRVMGQETEPAKMLSRAFKPASIEALHEKGRYLALGSGFKGLVNVARLGTSYLTSLVQHWIWLVCVLVTLGYLGSALAQYSQPALLCLLSLGAASVLVRYIASRDYRRFRPRLQRRFEDWLNGFETLVLVGLLCAGALWGLGHLPAQLDGVLGSLARSFERSPALVSALAWLDDLRTATLEASGLTVALSYLSQESGLGRWSGNFIARYGGLGLWISASVTFILTWITSPNSTSLHRYYSARLADAFLVLRRRGKLTLNQQMKRAGGLFHQTVPLSALDSSNTYGPYPLFNGCVNLLGNDPNFAGQQTGDYFVFSPRFCGAKLTGYARTGKGGQYGRLTLAEAVTCSGAAISPFQGRAMPSLTSTLLWLFNLRTDLWLPNPNFARPRSHRSIPWGPWHQLLALAGKLDTESPFINVSDGAFIDSLGIYELLRRRCARIVAVDATWDPHYDFHTLRNLIQRARQELNVTFVFDEEPELAIKPNVATGISPGCVARAKITWENGQVGELLYVKTAVLYDAPGDGARSADPSRAYATYHPDFPQQSTHDQFFDPIQWQAYHDLGRTMARQLLAYMRRQPLKPHEQREASSGS